MQLTYSDLADLHHKRQSAEWVEVSHERTLSLFHDAAERVPAYKDFLAHRNIDHRSIITWEDFKRVPLVDKNNYLRAFPLPALCFDGAFKEKALVFTATSGSTGEPFYFPRFTELDWQYSTLLEEFLAASSYGRRGPTLVIVGLGMGVWIGGLITYRAFEIVSQRGNFPLSILTPGSNKHEIIFALQKLGPHFEQVVLVGYPPFVKDTLDEAVRVGVPFHKMHLRLLFAAEAFTDTFRRYIAERAGIRNVYRDTKNIYGSADIGAMAAETPASILLRELAQSDEHLRIALFGNAEKLPTLAQFDPSYINFESVDGTIALTGTNALPLVRYAIGDSGGVRTWDEVVEIFSSHGVDVGRELAAAGLGDTVSKIPFVYVTERQDFSVKLCGATLFPEHVRMALEDPSFVGFLTGKFTMITRHDAEQNQYLEVNVELTSDAKENPDLSAKVEEMIIKKLVSHNSEYAYLQGLMAERVRPRLIFWPHNDPRHFGPGTKQKWVKSEPKGTVT